MKTFLSSTYVDLVEHRRAAKDALERLSSQVGRMEIFGARPEEPLEACLAEIDACDLFVGIYAHRYGHVPADSEFSITEEELKHAKKHNKPVFCFLVEEDYSWPPPMIENEPGKTKLSALKKVISSTLVRDTFTTPDNLAYKVGTSVGRYLISKTPIDTTRSVSWGRINVALPSRHETLHGRDEELDLLSRSLSHASLATGVAIEAIGGMGKTALARECCVSRELWKSFDIVLGAQALKRQMHVDPRSAINDALRVDHQGTVLRLREFLVTIARQLDLQKAELRTEMELEREIMRLLAGRSALIILDNLETMADTVNVLELFGRVCSPPLQKVLITTRRFPAEPPTGFSRLPLNAIEDTQACRKLVVDQLRKHVNPKLASNEAIDAVVEVGRGHPLMLELLAGKLGTQGTGSILKLLEKWRSNPVDALNDEYLSALCEHVFDDSFLEHIGLAGANLLSVMALEDAGVEERAARIASKMSDEGFNSTLSRLFQANCIRRELYEELSVLTLHPLTQAYFRGMSK